MKIANKLLFSFMGLVVLVSALLGSAFVVATIWGNRAQEQIDTMHLRQLDALKLENATQGLSLALQAFTLSQDIYWELVFDDALLLRDQLFDFFKEESLTSPQLDNVIKQIDTLQTQQLGIELMVIREVKLGQAAQAVKLIDRYYEDRQRDLFEVYLQLREAFGEIQMAATDVADQTKRMIGWLLIASALLMFLLSGFVALWISRSMTKPIKYLAEASEKIAQGNYQHKINFKSNDELGQLVTAFNTMEDAIEKNTLSQVQTEKMSMLATVVAGSAHELRNPLMGIINYIEYCKKGDTDEAERVEYLDSALAETKRCTQIIDNLMRFSRRDGPKKDVSPHDVVEMVGRACSLLTYQVNQVGLDLQVSIPEDLPQAVMNPGEFEQVIMNLITNAIDALKNEPQKQVKIEAKVEGDYVMVHFSDNGSGMSAETLQQIWTPFFTTKDPGVGTGLGMPNCKAMIEGMGGTIEAESELGKGTKINIQLKSGLKYEVEI